MPDKIRWGVLGTANIARKQVIPAIQSSRNGTVLAVGSRDSQRARAYADDLGIERAYGSYEELLADPDIDAIYNPLPNDGHVPWSIAAAKAGKPTLCEKPIAITTQDAQKLVDVFKAEGVLLAEAFMYRYHPQHAHILKMMSEGAIGPLTLIETHFTYSLPFEDTTNVRLQADIGGGGLLDVGCYCVNLCRMIIGEEPESVSGQMLIGSKTKVDESFVGTLRFPGGILAHFDCGMRSTFRNSYTVIGPEGQITSDYAFRPENDGMTTIRVKKGHDADETIQLDSPNEYRLMVEDFADAVAQKLTKTYDTADTINNMKVLDALLRAAREGKTIRVE